MKISRLTKEQRLFFLELDPLKMMERLDFPGSFALVATETDESTMEDIPAGLMICSTREDSLIVEWLCVAGAYRTQNIGEKLLLAAFDAAEQGQIGRVYAYINSEDGRELLCQGEELFFKERLFVNESELPGEWQTDLKELSAQPYFRQKLPDGFMAVPLAKLTTAQAREAAALLAGQKRTSMLYPVTGQSSYLEAELSFVTLNKGRMSGGLFVQRVSRQNYELLGGLPVQNDVDVLYPVLFCAGSEPEARALLLNSLRAARQKYVHDTPVRVILGDDTYAPFLEKIMPGERTKNKVLIAEVADYVNGKPIVEAIAREWQKGEENEYQVF